MEPAATDLPTTTAVLGCGVIGSSWVTAFHAARHTVRVWDPDVAAAGAKAAKSMDAVTFCDTPEEAVEGARFVQENGPEDIAAKRALFARIGPSLDPGAVIASSTSTLQASDIQLGLDCADRILDGHPFNPPHVMPLVEVVGGAATAEWAIAFGLAEAGIASLKIWNRTRSKSEDLRERLLRLYPQLPIGIATDDPADAELVVNATSLGLGDGDPPPLDFQRLQARQVVAEIIMTPLLLAAEARGCRICLGAPMLDRQLTLMAEFMGVSR